MPLLISTKFLAFPTLQQRQRSKQTSTPWPRSIIRMAGWKTWVRKRRNRMRSCSRRCQTPTRLWVINLNEVTMMMPDSTEKLLVRLDRILTRAIEMNTASITERARHGNTSQAKTVSTRRSRSKISILNKNTTTWRIMDILDSTVQEIDIRLDSTIGQSRKHRQVMDVKRRVISSIKRKIRTPLPGTTPLAILSELKWDRDRCSFLWLSEYFSFYRYSRDHQSKRNNTTIQQQISTKYSSLYITSTKTKVKPSLHSRMFLKRREAIPRR